MVETGKGLVLVNGPANSVQGPRARALFEGAARIVYKDRGRLGSVRRLGSALSRRGLDWIYAFDLGIPGSPLAALRRRLDRGVRLVYEIGDPAGPLLRNQGRAWWETAAAEWIDRAMPGHADALVFRGSYLAAHFASLAPKRQLPRWVWLPDGADMNRFRPLRDDPRIHELRRRHGLEEAFVVGIVGNIHHNPTCNLFYGWDLAEMLARRSVASKRPVIGVVVGDGPGRSALEAARDRLGLGERLRIVGRVPHDEVPLWMNLFDVGISTQTDDPVGWGRTTAKLPEYLGCGTVVLCSDVGEAHRWLGASGQTLPYHGLRDEHYPTVLAAKITELLDADLEPTRRQNRQLALQLFDYRTLRDQVMSFLAGNSETASCQVPPTPIPKSLS